MSIEELLAGLPHRWARGNDDVDVAEVTHDSRKAGPGVVFVAVRGAKLDGLSFASEAVAAGAVAVVASSGRAVAPQLAGAGRVIEVDDDRTALAVMARNLHGRADEKLAVIGVTGTNGKTTTCRVTAKILEAAGIRTGVLGTVAYSLGGTELAAERTTPEAPDLHRYLARMVASGCGACVMEVSSHALELRRVHGMRFAVAVFTNLTPEHLDFHGNMSRYFDAKATLFDGLEPGSTAVINADDDYGRKLASRIGQRAAEGGAIAPRLVTFGSAEDAEIRIASMQSGVEGLTMTLESAGRTVSLRSPLVGRFNGYNVAAASAAARAMGVEWDAIGRGVAAATTVPGRMERIGDQDFAVIVDYAHKEEALRVLLETARALTAGRLILVFGCGGDRDRTKRPLMGRHAARLADVVWVTSDNPRSERPESIIEEILAGMPGADRQSGRIHVEPDRGKAIEAAIGAARSGDSVVIAGKGHETYQIIGDRVTPFDDRSVARSVLARLQGDRGADGSP